MEENIKYKDFDCLYENTYEAKTWHLIFLPIKTNKILKTTSAYTESTDLTLEAIKKNVHLVIQSL